MSPTAGCCFSTSFFSKQEIACHSLLFHYKGEGFTCDLSAREPLLLSELENPERIPALCGNVTLDAHFSPRLVL